jgi:hypothetical protein
MPKKSQVFSVAITGISLTPAQKRQLNGVIQKAALGAIAELGVRGPFTTHFPREWWGIWLQPAKLNPKDLQAGPAGVLKGR